MILNLCATLAMNLEISLFLAPIQKHLLNLSRINDFEPLAPLALNLWISLFLAPCRNTASTYLKSMILILWNPLALNL